MKKYAFQEKYPNLFKPMYVGKKNIEFKNRVFAAPMGGGTFNDANGVINAAGVDYYGSIAKGGFGSVCVPLEIPKDGGHTGALSLDEEVMGFAMMHNLQNVIHAYRAKSFCEIYHPGICMLPMPGRTILGPSAMTYAGNEVKEMDEDDMEEVAQLYADAAFMCKRAGFDGILLHFAHGWLISNFLSPLSNFRKDKYGGSVENRCRFPQMVIERIRQAVGDDMIIELRINGNDKMKGGVEKEDAAQQLLILQENVDMAHISCGVRLDATSRPKMHPTCYVADAHNVEDAAYIKSQGVKIPIGSVGSIHDPELAERLIAEGKIDYILMGRQTVADAQWVNKVRAGREEDIRPCIRCDYCLDGGRRGALTKEVNIKKDSTFDSHCTVNPIHCQSRNKLKFVEYNVPSKKVGVIGGGIAGMQAALAAADQGHTVTLYEKNAVLGGQTAIYGPVIWFKKYINQLRQYFIAQVRKNPNITVLLNCEATPEIIAEAEYDIIIVAVGAVQAVPPIKGIDGDNVILAWDALASEEKFGKKVVVVGGGAVGCEVGIHYAYQGHKVSIIEMTEWLAGTAQVSERMSIQEEIDKKEIATYLESKVTEIVPEGVKVVDKDGNENLIEADKVIICAGSKANREESMKFNGLAYDVIKVGDCVKAADLRVAIETAYDAGTFIQG